jgi:hypothetical protein
MINRETFLIHMTSEIVLGIKVPKHGHGDLRSLLLGTVRSLAFSQSAALTGITAGCGVEEGKKALLLSDAEQWVASLCRGRGHLLMWIA